MKKRVSFDVFRQYYRQPAGAKSALIKELRTVPPNDWDDIPHDKNKTQLCSYLRRMFLQKIPREQVTAKLLNKGFSGNQAKWLIDHYYW